MSANADDDTRSDVFAVGMDAFVPKPFDYKRLVDALQHSPVLGEVMRRRGKELRDETMGL
jgi:CheY-like chemotaxis protein